MVDYMFGLYQSVIIRPVKCSACNIIILYGGLKSEPILKIFIFVIC